MITLITPTGTRPEAWELCKHHMRNQTYKEPVRWIIVDDGDEPQSMVGIPDHWVAVVVYPSLKWSEGGPNTLTNNLLAAKPFVNAADSVIIIADDDYYHPTYVDYVVRRLGVHELIGIANTPFFDVSRMTYRRQPTLGHASLGATAMRSGALAMFWTTLEEGGRMSLWRRFYGPKHLSTPNLVVGIKGLPGRPCTPRVSSISDSAQLRALVGEDAFELYRPYLGSALEY